MAVPDSSHAAVAKGVIRLARLVEEPHRSAVPARLQVRQLLPDAHDEKGATEGPLAIGK